MANISKYLSEATDPYSYLTNQNSILNGYTKEMTIIL